MVMSTVFAELALYGLLLGGIYGLAASGLSLMWGVMKVINVAHGEFIMLGAYIAYWLYWILGIHPLISALVAFPLGYVLGLVIYKLVIEKVLGSGELLTLIATFGIAIVTVNLATVAWTGDIRSVPEVLPILSFGSTRLSVSRVLAFLAALSFALALWVFLTRTYYGKAIRAVSQDHFAARVVGVNISKVSLMTFGIGLALAMSTGSLIVLPVPSVTPYIGELYILISFSIVVLGGIGSVLGSLVGGLIMGVAETYVSFFNPALSPVVSFTVLILVLLLRPEGVFGRRV